MRIFSCFFAGALAFTALTGCSNDSTDKEGGKKVGFYQALLQALGQAQTLSVVDDGGKPVANAQILIGSSGSFSTTDAQGRFLVPSTWTSAQAVTISASGYVRATYLAQNPGSQVFTLRKNSSHGTFEVTGKTPGVDVVPDDGNAYFSLVIPVLHKADLLHFNIGMVISPENDQLSIIGQKLSLPSNITLPRQQQSYILPFTLDKPIYRSFFDSPGSKKVMTLAGRFPFNKVVDEIRSKTVPFYMIANDMEILSGGVMSVNLAGGTTNLDIPANQFAIDSSRSINASNVANGEVIVGISLSDSNGDLIPTDVKVLSPGASNSLRVQSKASAQVLSVVKRQNEMQTGAGEDRLSAVLVPFTDGVSPEALPLLDNPQMLSNSKLQLQKIQLPSGLSALATYASLQSVQTTIMQDGSKHQTLTQVWEVYAPEWLDVIEIPTWPGESAPASGMRWSVAYLAGAQKASLDLGPAVMQSVTHVTNTSIDF